MAKNVRNHCEDVCFLEPWLGFLLGFLPGHRMAAYGGNAHGRGIHFGITAENASAKSDPVIRGASDA